MRRGPVSPSTPGTTSIVVSRRSDVNPSASSGLAPIPSRASCRAAEAWLASKRRESRSMAFWQFLGDLHPKLVQFPLVLLLAGLVFDACGLVARSPRLHFAARALSTAGVFFLLL